MLYSARDLARKAAEELSRSADRRLVAGAAKVEESLSPTGEPSKRFDLTTAIEVAGLIVKLAEFGYKVWSDTKKKPASSAELEAAVMAEAKREGIKADLEILAETTKVIARILERD